MSLRSQKRRKRLSMTSLIDVIFLLLLFFMLSSTFSRFAEVELQAGGSGAGAAGSSGEILFLQVTADGFSLNGQPVTIEVLPNRLTDRAEDSSLLVSVSDDASSQTLADLLVTIRPFPDLPVIVLDAS